MLNLLRQLREQLRCAINRIAELGSRSTADLVAHSEELLAQTPEGVFFYDARDIFVGGSIASGSWEPVETTFIKSIVRPGDCVLDVGANLGWYTVVMARLVGAEGRVVAFEPDPRNFGLLGRNVQENDLVDRCTLFQIALLEQAGLCRLERSPRNFGDHRVRFGSPDAYGECAFGEHQRTEITVRSNSLDATLSQAGFFDKSWRLLKMDAQGSEISILKGAPHTLGRIDYVVTEYWPYGLTRSGCGADDFLSCIGEFFSEFCRLTEGEQSFQPICELREDLTKPMNIDSGALAHCIYVFRKTAVESTPVPPIQT